jgi:hypothetical protein
MMAIGIPSPLRGKGETERFLALLEMTVIMFVDFLFAPSCRQSTVSFPRKRESSKHESVHPELVEGFIESMMNGSFLGQAQGERSC